MFQKFFEIADKNGGSLDIPLQLIMDDFAAGGEINAFEQYISVIREARMSVMLLLQSEAQLSKIYGEDSARTIVDNCDTTINFSSNSSISCKHIAERIDRPLSEVLAMPIGKQIVIRRGQKPQFYINRYPILEDPEYKKLVYEVKKRKKQEKSEDLRRII